MLNRNSITLPPIAALDAAAAELVTESASQAQKRAIDKAIWQFHQGLQIVPTSGAFLVPSFGNAGVIYRVSHVDGCSCQAGQSGKHCKHAEVIRIVERAQTRAVSLPDRIAARRKALIEMDELFS